MEASLGGPFAFSLQAARSIHILSFSLISGRAQELKTTWCTGRGRLHLSPGNLDQAHWPVNGLRDRPPSGGFLMIEEKKKKAVQDCTLF